MSERITVIGAGIVGVNLAEAFVAAGHQVRLAARDAASDKVATAVERLELEVVALDEAASDTDIVVLAVPYAAVADTVRVVGAGPDVIVVDATNTLGTELPAGAGSILDVIAGAGGTAPLVKAFNTIGAEAFLEPVVNGTPLFLPVAGDSPAADRVTELARSIGFDAVTIGDRTAAHYNESHAAMWIHLAFQVGIGRDFGFARLDR